jgi:hypothetical protein
MTLALPEDLKAIMDRHKEVKWSEVARRALWEHAKKLELLDRLLSKSEMTEEDAITIGRKIKSAMAGRHGL